MVLLLGGVLLAEIARRQVDRLAEQMDLPGPLGMIVEIGVVAVFGVTALAELGVPVNVLLLIVAIVLSGAALTFALAFGLGGQAMAREVSARRYVEGAYEVGEEVSLSGVRGRIAAIDATCTVLETTAASACACRTPSSSPRSSRCTPPGSPT